MLDFRRSRPSVWPEHLKPEGEGSIHKESFEPWWARHAPELAHIHPQLAEQWIHRHWGDTEFDFLPLETLAWELVTLSGEEILASVTREVARNLDPEFDYEQFQGMQGFPKAQTAIELDEGSWRLPIVTLSTPSGWLARRGPLPGERLMLLEGHQRHRYLNALHALAMPPKGPHQMFIVQSPVVG